MFCEHSKLVTYNKVGGYMSKLTSFKEFVKNNPSLVKFVKEDKMTWQKFYEMFDLYGSNHEVWNDYLTKKEEKVVEAATTTAGITDFLSWFKSIDLDSLQEGINSVSRVVGVLQDFGNKDNTSNVKTEYKPRPLYKHFED